MAAQLLELSHELLHCIFIEILPSDLASLTASCRTLHSYINGNRLLHKDLYIRRYDPPPEDTDWESALHSNVQLERLLVCSSRPTKKAHLGVVAKGVERLVATAAKDAAQSRNISLLSEAFHDTDNIDTFLCSSSLFDRAGNDLQSPAETEELRQASAKLHCLYGVPIDVLPSASTFTSLLLTHLNGVTGGSATITLSRMEDGSSSSAGGPPSACTRAATRPLVTHTFARSKVYDLREYSEGSLWGPFHGDGSMRVDWEKVEAIMIVLGFNLRKFADRSGGRFPRVWEDAFVGATAGSYRSPGKITASEEEGDREEEELEPELKRVRDLALDLDSRDPYGVSGSWMRVVCFLDYNDLYTFNFTDRLPDGERREPIDTEEAIRLIRIKLQVTRIDPPGTPIDDDDSEGEANYSDDEEWGDEPSPHSQQDLSGEDWSNFHGERLPIVHFRGTSRSLHASWDPNANSRIRGTVRQTPEGEIRWTTFSIFHGEERWRSEGVQVGGVGSARGILGNWFDKDFDDHGPAGPTAFWKESDELGEDKGRMSWLPSFG
ncbi:uncharacterized protein RCC_09874 [Ramularia collo-cygni]|uniref:F-box domain-containing protein n=1 Tax=Ramularia collo-cygni TaxID=112498 RepID=A0A2D3V1F6_9PEZI|nr:uncharacterized protein RCC_09874 [Ramularia collo-cygni]CZT24157.1 uncharacterized protein RCC_09874 [Ramularia collo-cygni]